MGHIGTLLPIADALVSKGHEIVLVLKNLSHAPSIIAGRHSFLQAPHRIQKSLRHRNFESFADIILHAGFDSLELLEGLVTAWHALYAQAKPDWVIYNHAPLALFAARGLPFKKTCVGSGFENPPGFETFPRFRYWMPDSTDGIAHRRKTHELAFRNGNAVASKLGMPLLQRLPDIFSEADIRLVTFPCLDHYPERGGGEYIGLINMPEMYTPMEQRDGERWLFCYLWARYRGSLELLKDLADAPGFKTFAVVPDLAGSGPDRLRHKNLTLTRQPASLGTLSNWAEGVLCHASHGTAACALSQGLPVLSFPVTLEQAMLAQRVEAAGAGITLHTEDGPQEKKVRLVANTLDLLSCKRGARAIRAATGGVKSKTGSDLLASLE